MGAGLVYSYLRFSDPKQSAGGSVDRQLAYASRWAAENGLELDTKLDLRDEGLSAYHQKHITSGALGAFLRAVEDGLVPDGSVLIVEGLDRLSRAEPIQAQAQLAQIVNAGITVVTASDGKSYSRQRLKDNPMDLVYSLLVMIRAHEESDTKSKRVKASIRRLCEKWIDGSYRGAVQQGRDPLWLDQTEAGWAINEAAAESIRRVIELYQAGFGAMRIVQTLDAEGLRMYTKAKANQTQQIYRLIKLPQLAGHKPVTVDGEEFLLRDYYPALIDDAAWDELQRVSSQQGRRRIVGDLPHIITGIGITFCGYCGKPMAGQHLTTKPRLPDGRLRDGNRRLLCASASAYGGGCPVPGSTSVAPVERAIMDYCSDIINLQSLYGSDRSAAPRKRAQQARKAVETIKKQLDKITEAMLASEDEGTPLVFARKAREIEVKLQAAEREAEDAERELASTARKDLSNENEEWLRLAKGVEDQEVEARLQARQLVADTFERIEVWHHGMEPDPEASERDYCIDILLLAKGGQARILRIDRHGDWIAGSEHEFDADRSGKTG